MYGRACRPLTFLLSTRRTRSAMPKRARDDGPEGYEEWTDTPLDLNEDMHDANPYKRSKPDFAALGVAYPALGLHLTRRGAGGLPSLDWKKPAAVRELTRALLANDFQLQWDMPLDRLCPPVPNRLNYLCWLGDLLQLRSDTSSSSTSNTAAAAASTNVRGIDIGTGASCIYPLLGHRSMGWSFVATDVDAESVQWARHNVSTNQLQSAIEVRHVSPITAEAGPLLAALTAQDGQFDFVMTNPPFFSTLEEAASNPYKATAGMASASELVCPGK
jgi:23S rRNA A1618 N6-methylase RlmF